ncbi:MAG: acyl-CoA thioesterase [Deltaproteobacteria bacterium]|nr:acyl-CoA thioesterase [Candidatus Anaeroferrophillacea bacterium]
MLEITVQSTHLDMFGHVNNATYVEYLEWARVKMAAEAGIDLIKMFHEGVGPAVLKLEINYRKESRLGDVLLVDAHCTRTRGDKVGIINQTIRNQATGDLVCDAEVTFVMFDLQHRRSVPLPESMRRMCTGPAPNDPASNGPAPDYESPIHESPATATITAADGGKNGAN